MELLAFQIAIPFFLLMVGAEVWHESRNPHKTYRFNNALANLCVGVMELILGASSHLLLLFLYALVFEKLGLFTLPESPLTYLAVFLGYEFFYYWKHRMGHEINLMWGGHIVHHQSEDLNFTAALRLSATSPVWGIPFYMPLALLGFSPIDFVIVQIISHIYQFFIHTEHIGKLPVWYEFIFNTPSHHRVHHGREAKYIDRNYGSILILWDRLFQTFQEEEERPEYGVTTQLQSWNPFFANLAYYLEMFSLFRMVRRPGEAWRILFGRPGDTVFPSSNVSEDNRKAEQGLVDKYDVQPGSRLLKIYAGIQFVPGLLASFVLLHYYHDFHPLMVLLFTIWSLWLISMVGLLLEANKKPVLRLEVFKLLSLPVMAVFYIQWTSYHMWS